MELMIKLLNMTVQNLHTYIYIYIKSVVLKFSMEYH